VARERSTRGLPLVFCRRALRPTVRGRWRADDRYWKMATLLRINGAQVLRLATPATAWGFLLARARGWPAAAWWPQLDLGEPNRGAVADLPPLAPLPLGRGGDTSRGAGAQRARLLGRTP